MKVFMGILLFLAVLSLVLSVFSDDCRSYAEKTFVSEIEKRLPLDAPVDLTADVTPDGFWRNLLLRGGVNFSFSANTYDWKTKAEGKAFYNLIWRKPARGHVDIDSAEISEILRLFLKNEQDSRKRQWEVEGKVKGKVFYWQSEKNPREFQFRGWLFSENLLSFIEPSYPWKRFLGTFEDRYENLRTVFSGTLSDSDIKIDAFCFKEENFSLEMKGEIPFGLKRDKQKDGEILLYFDLNTKYQTPQNNILRHLHISINPTEFLDPFPPCRGGKIRGTFPESLIYSCRKRTQEFPLSVVCAPVAE